MKEANENSERFSMRPRPECRLGWRYLTGEMRMPRMVESLEPYTVRHASMTIEVDAALPYEEESEAQVARDVHWLIPAAFFEKRPVAPDLEVCGAGGGIISVPTKHENQELTLAALEHMHEEGLFDLNAHPDLRKIVGDIVCMRPLVAHVAILQLRERLPQLPDLLHRLLTRLADHFVLWVPAKGSPGSTHHFRIRRRQPRIYPPIIPNKAKQVEKTIHTALGPTTILGVGPFGRRTFVGSQSLERILRMMGLAPISVVEYFQEACRVDSYHAQLKSPQDFLVREVRLARVMGGGPSERKLEELDDEPNQMIQGHESEVAHVHCVRRQDRAPLMLEVLLGVRDGLTTLWALGVVMTAIILLIFKHDVAPATEKGHLEVAAAILLLGPALAAAWAVRSDDGHLLRNVLSGTRQLLMGSALLSVAAALALIGYSPLGLSQVHALEWYAAAAYAIAVIVVISWSITRRTPWIFYRFLLHSPRRNLCSTAVLAAVAAVLLAHGGVPDVVVGGALLALGLMLAIISANRVGVEMGGGSRPFAPIAGLAATLAFLAAGAFVGYYEDAIDLGALRIAAAGSEGLLAGLATYRAFDA
jgi:hypothetical protein